MIEQKVYKTFQHTPNKVTGFHDLIKQMCYVFSSLRMSW